MAVIYTLYSSVVSQSVFRPSLIFESKTRSTLRVEPLQWFNSVSLASSNKAISLVHQSIIYHCMYIFWLLLSFLVKSQSVYYYQRKLSGNVNAVILEPALGGRIQEGRIQPCSGKGLLVINGPAYYKKMLKNRLLFKKDCQIQIG